MKIRALQLILAASLLMPLAGAGQDTVHHVCSHFWKNGQPVFGVDYVINVEGGPVPASIFVNGDPGSGCVDLPPFSAPSGGTLQVNGTKDTGHLNGVTAFDLSLIAWHILNLEPFMSPFAMMAADANKSNSITSFDIVETRKLLLGVYTGLPNSESWRFFPADCDFNPFPPPSGGLDCPVITELPAGDTTHLIGLKVGDVDGSANPQSINAPVPTFDSVLLSIAPATFQAGDSVDIPVTLETLHSISALQGEWVFDTSLVEFVGLTDNGIPLSPQSYARLGEDRFRLVFFRADLDTYPDGQVLVTIRLFAKQPGMVQNALWLDSAAPLQPLAFGSSPYQLKFGLPPVLAQTAPASGSWTVRCSPNPFSDRTELSFNLQQSAEISLQVYDLTGRRTYAWEGPLPAGPQRLEIPGAALPKGLSIYRLSAGRQTASGRVIRH